MDMKKILIAVCSVLAAATLVFGVLTVTNIIKDSDAAPAAQVPAGEETPVSPVKIQGEVEYDAAAKELDAVQFIKRLKTRATALNVSDEMLKRSVNTGFSGGEKKKMETFQMAFLEPDFCILDEMDAGLDIDALKTVSDSINVMKEKTRSFLLITHFQRLLDYVEPDYIHIMIDGKIVKSGDKSLAKSLEEKGYDEYK